MTTFGLDDPTVREKGNARFGLWLIRLLTWDGLLPACIWSAPIVVRLLTARRGAVEITAVSLPIFAFFIRYRVGRQLILANGCRDLVRGVQLAVLCFGILVLLFIDAIVILAHVVPQGAGLDLADAWRTWAFAYSLYLVAMAFAMFPGSAPTRTGQSGDLAEQPINLGDDSRALLQCVRAWDDADGGGRRE
jgi:hypothetical protein